MIVVCAPRRLGCEGDAHEAGVVIMWLSVQVTGCGRKCSQEELGLWAPSLTRCCQSTLCLVLRGSRCTLLTAAGRWRLMSYQQVMDCQVHPSQGVKCGRWEGRVFEMVKSASLCMGSGQKDAQPEKGHGGVCCDP